MNKQASFLEDFGVFVLSNVKRAIWEQIKLETGMRKEIVAVLENWDESELNR